MESTMEHPPGHDQGILGIIISFSSAFIAVISALSLETFVSIVASIIAIAGGIFAGMYYYEAWKEKKRINNRFIHKKK